MAAIIPKEPFKVNFDPDAKILKATLDSGQSKQVVILSKEIFADIKEKHVSIPDFFKTVFHETITPRLGGWAGSSRSFDLAKDVQKGYLLIRNPANKQEVYLQRRLSEDNPITLKELIQWVENSLNKKAEANYEFLKKIVADKKMTTAHIIEFFHVAGIEPGSRWFFVDGAAQSQTQDLYTDIQNERPELLAAFFTASSGASIESLEDSEAKADSLSPLPDRSPESPVIALFKEKWRGISTHELTDAQGVVHTFRNRPTSIEANSGPLVREVIYSELSEEDVIGFLEFINFKIEQSDLFFDDFSSVPNEFYKRVEKEKPKIAAYLKSTMSNPDFGVASEVRTASSADSTVAVPGAASAAASSAAASVAEAPLSEASRVLEARTRRVIEEFRAGAPISAEMFVFLPEDVFQEALTKLVQQAQASPLNLKGIVASFMDKWNRPTTFTEIVSLEDQQRADIRAVAFLEAVLPTQGASFKAFGAPHMENLPTYSISVPGKIDDSVISYEYTSGVKEDVERAGNSEENTLFIVGGASQFNGAEAPNVYTVQPGNTVSVYGGDRTQGPQLQLAFSHLCELINGGSNLGLSGIVPALSEATKGLVKDGYFMPTQTHSANVIRLLRENHDKIHYTCVGGIPNGGKKIVYELLVAAPAIGYTYIDPLQKKESEEVQYLCALNSTRAQYEQVLALAQEAHTENKEKKIKFMLAAVGMGVFENLAEPVAKAMRDATLEYQVRLKENNVKVVFQVFHRGEPNIALKELVRDGAAKTAYLLELKKYGEIEKEGAAAAASAAE